AGSLEAARPISGPCLSVEMDAVVEELRALGAHVETGVFGADMKVSLVNDGPITLIVEV
ncbi:D-aminoacyl-tRNA deacylase, partial [Nonomuraea sp. NPDC049784]|uniref:D-aminoacyl-tRNA deacylase n=1 Tax=Nonomuraea sp. NPDC049784 TaxID=3154361 RepID=UPI0033CFB0EE